jgi:hypothetical protein
MVRVARLTVLGTALIVYSVLIYNKGVDDTSKGISNLIRQREQYKEAMWRYKTLFEAKDAEYYILSLKYKKQLLFLTYGK